MTKIEFKFRWPDKSKVSKGAFFIVRKLRRAGYEAFIAGGAVRDALIKKPIEDVDIATSAKPAAVKKLFAKTIPTGEKHGTITVHPHSFSPYLRNKQGEMKRGYEVTTFRLEGPYKDRRHPSRVRFINDAARDAARRDFTINALFYDDKKNCVIDYVNGIADISHRKIRFVGKADDRIREDALRLLRAIRFSTVLGFGLARDTQKAVKKYARLIKQISAERVKQELDRIMLSDRAAIGLGLLDIVGLLEYVLPELKAGQGVTQPKNQHSEGDVYAHSLLALEKLDRKADLATRYATLFHDLGKVNTRKVRDGKITFYGHPEAGEKIVVEMGKRLKFSGAEIAKIFWLVRSHMVPFDLPSMKLSTRRKWALAPFFPDLLLLNTADCWAGLRPSGRGFNNAKFMKIAEEAIREMKIHPELKVPLLSGNEVMSALKIKSGPMVGKILKLIEEKKLANELKTKSEAVSFLKKLLDKSLSTLYS